MTDYPYKAAIENSVAAFSNCFQPPEGGPREYSLANRCRADFCYNIIPKGRLFIEDDDGARAVNNLIKYWIWCEQNLEDRPAHLIHIVETTRPAQIRNIKFLERKMRQHITRFQFHLLPIDNWQVPDNVWVPKLQQILAQIAKEGVPSGALHPHCPLTRDEIHVGLDYYEPENRVFPRIAQKVANHDQLDACDVLLILKWKLGRIRDDNTNTVSPENLHVINDAVHLVGQEEDQEIQALNELRQVPGIDLAVASAILSVCYSDKFTIIDRRVLETLDLMPSTQDAAQWQEMNNADRYNTSVWDAETYWQEFLPRVREYAGDQTLRESDQALWGLSVARRVQQILEQAEG